MTWTRSAPDLPSARRSPAQGQTQLPRSPTWASPQLERVAPSARLRFHDRLGRARLGLESPQAKPPRQARARLQPQDLRRQGPAWGASVPALPDTSRQAPPPPPLRSTQVRSSTSSTISRPPSSAVRSRMSSSCLASASTAARAPGAAEPLPFKHARNVVDDLVVGLALAALKTLLVGLALRGGVLAWRARLVFRDDPANGG